MKNVRKDQQTQTSPSPKNSSGEIKFSEILNGLIEDSPFKKNRRPIWEAINVTSAALSQYVMGQSRPRLETLVDLADFFNVSLDYLVRGRETRRVLSDDSKSVARYVDWALADIQTRTGAKSWLVARIGETLASQIEAAANEAVAEVSAMEGVVSEEDLLRLEGFSLETRLMLTYLDYNIIESVPNGPAVGRFTQTVALNLRSKPVHSYKFLLPFRKGHAWDSTVKNFHCILREEFGVSKTHLRHCEFRITDQKFACGSGFYRLDMKQVRKQMSNMSFVLQDYISDSGWLGYVTHPNAETRGDILYDMAHLPIAFDIWDEFWEHAQVME